MRKSLLRELLIVAGSLVAMCLSLWWYMSVAGEPDVAAEPAIAARASQTAIEIVLEGCPFSLNATVQIAVGYDSQNLGVDGVEIFNGQVMSKFAFLDVPLAGMPVPAASWVLINVQLGAGAEVRDFLLAASQTDLTGQGADRGGRLAAGRFDQMVSECISTMTSNPVAPSLDGRSGV